MDTSESIEQNFMYERHKSVKRRTLNASCCRCSEVLTIQGHSLVQVI